MSENNERLNTSLHTPEEIVLSSTFKGGFLKRFLFGILYGLAIIIPGISGAAIAIIFKIYDELIYSISKIFKHFKKCLSYLLPILFGFIIGFVVGFFAIQKLLDIIPFSVIMLFAGLMIGSFPAVKKEIKGNKVNAANTTLLALGILIPLTVLILAVTLNFDSIVDSSKGIVDSVDDATRLFKDFPVWMFIVSLPIGMVMGMTQVVPGLSASAFLMMIGWFSPLMDSIHFDYIKNNPKIIIILLVLIIGFVLGFFLTSKGVEYFVKKNRVLSYQFIVGLSIGSIVTMFLSPDIMTIYLSWYYQGLSTTLKIVDVSLSAPLLIGGFILSYYLVRYEMKKTAVSNNENQNS